MKSQISWVIWGQDESKVLVCWCSFSETVSTPDLQSCLLQGERGSVLIAETCSVHIKGSLRQEPQWALTWGECWKQEGTSHSSLYPLPPEHPWKGIFAVWFWTLGKQKDSQGAHCGQRGPLDYISALSDLFFIEKIIYFHYERFGIW